MPNKRKPVPSYKKVYSVYQYDRLKYAQIYKKIQKLSLEHSFSIFKRTNPYRVLEHCYIKDEFNHKQHLGDEPHIFRYRALEKILTEIGEFIIVAYEILPTKEVLNYLFKHTHLILYCENNSFSAELLETIHKPIKLRLKVHIALLKELYKGVEIEEAVKIAKSKYNL